MLDVALDITTHPTQPPPWTVQAADLRLRGLTMREIAQRVGKKPMTVSSHLPQGLTVFSAQDLAELRSVDAIPADPDAFLKERYEQRRQRSWLRKQRRREQRARQRTQRRYRWSRSNVRRRVQVVSFDAPPPDGNFALRERIVDPTRVGLDPFQILAGTTEEHLAELLGDLTLEDVARMDEHNLARLRERIMDAGLAPPSVQRTERERLKVTTPHRGHAPSPTTGRKQSRHRGRNEASALHKSKGRRFKRQEKERHERDGWGGVVLP